MNWSFKIGNKKKRLMYSIFKIVCISIVFVLVLNFVLIQPAFFDIVEKDTTSSVWLQFWGGFITAIGTLALAYCTWKTIHEENHRFKCEMQNHDYDILEKTVIKNERIHNFEYLKLIVSVYISDGYVSSQKIWLNLFIELQTAANEIVRFNNHKDEKYKQYGIVLSTLNQRLYTLVLILQSRIEWHEKLIVNPVRDEYAEYLTRHGINYKQDEQSNDMQKFLEFAQEYYEEIVVVKSPYSQMVKLGNELLQQHYDSIMQEMQKLEDI